ncbi:MAG: hypothetical protein Q7S41_00835 [Candidatus Limnocylindria bacterium]|nr:hypothetical protein [Candidatus Limnocylindria bacterium]
MEDRVGIAVQHRLGAGARVVVLDEAPTPSFDGLTRDTRPLKHVRHSHADVMDPVVRRGRDAERRAVG